MIIYRLMHVCLCDNNLNILIMNHPIKVVVKKDIETEVRFLFTFGSKLILFAYI